MVVNVERVIMKNVVFAAAFVFVATACAAQGVINPTKAEYTVSADHAQVTKYVIGYFIGNAASPVQSADLPVTAPDAQQKVVQAINAVPLGFGTYTAKLKAVVGAVEGEWSEASNEFMRAPFPPTAPTVKK